MATRNYEEAFAEFAQNHTTLKDVLKEETLKVWDTLTTETKATMLHRKLLEHLENDPDFELWVPLEYWHYAVSPMQDAQVHFITNNVYISSKGRIYNFRRQVKDEYGDLQPTGYRYGRVTEGSTKNSFMIHRAVACCFVPKPEELTEINYTLIQANHRDNDFDNNDFRNIEWQAGTQERSVAIENELKEYERQHLDELTRPVLATSVEGVTTGQQFVLVGETEIMNHGFSVDDVYDCCNGMTDSSQGYTWQWIQEDEIDKYPRGILMVNSVDM